MVNLEKLSDAQQRFNYVYTTIRKRICLLEYEPGLRLSEEKLAKEFNISRTPIRRVLSTLENEGLVEIRHGAGNYVSTIELGYLCDIYAMRMELMMMVSRNLKDPLPDSVLPKMYALLEKGQNVDKKKSASKAFAEINLEFFELTMEMVESRALREILAILFYKSSRMWPFLVNNVELIRKEKSILNEEITDLIRILESGNYNSISTILRFHIESSLYRLQSYCLDS